MEDDTRRKSEEKVKARGSQKGDDANPSPTSKSKEEQPHKSECEFCKGKCQFIVRDSDDCLSIQFNSHKLTSDMLMAFILHLTADPKYIDVIIKGDLHGDPDIFHANCSQFCPEDYKEDVREEWIKKSELELLAVISKRLFDVANMKNITYFVDGNMSGLACELLLFSSYRICTAASTFSWAQPFRLANAELWRFVVHKGHPVPKSKISAKEAQKLRIIDEIQTKSHPSEARDHKHRKMKELEELFDPENRFEFSVKRGITAVSGGETHIQTNRMAALITSMEGVENIQSFEDDEGPEMDYSYEAADSETGSNEGAEKRKAEEDALQKARAEAEAKRKIEEDKRKQEQEVKRKQEEEAKRKQEEAAKRKKDSWDPKTKTLKVFYGTDRNPILDRGKKVVGFDDSQGSVLHTGTLDMKVDIPGTEKMGQTFKDYKRVDIKVLGKVSDNLKVTGYKSMDKDEFRNALYDYGNGRHAFVFIHGYSNGFDSAAKIAALMGRHLRIDGISSFFSWASNNYWAYYPDDARRIIVSEGPFKEFLNHLIVASDASEIHLIAHSMGNRLLSNTIRNLWRDQHNHEIQGNDVKPAPLGAIILAAPDVASDDLTTIMKEARDITQKRVTLYTNHGDCAVWMSSFVNWSSRAGYYPPIYLFFENVNKCVDTISVVGVTGLIGHSYWTSIADDIQEILSLGTQPSQRGRLTMLYDKEQIDSRRYYKYDVVMG